VKQFGNVIVVIARLRALATRDDVDSDQKKHVEGAIKALQRLRRNPHLSQDDVFACVREVAERLLDAFFE
jgi:pantoate kinase